MVDQSRVPAVKIVLTSGGLDGVRQGNHPGDAFRDEMVRWLNLGKL